MPLVSRTRATLRSAEFGFFGVFVYTRVQTPRRWGAPLRAGVFVLVVFDCRPLRTSCWMVGTKDRGYLRTMRSINPALVPGAGWPPSSRSRVGPTTRVRVCGAVRNWAMAQLGHSSYG